MVRDASLRDAPHHEAVEGISRHHPNPSSTSTLHPFANLFVSFAIPTTAISSPNIASLMPALRAAAPWLAMQ
jgi:hypothetical protein